MSTDIHMREDSSLCRIGAEVRETGISVGKEGLVMGEKDK